MKLLTCRNLSSGSFAEFGIVIDAAAMAPESINAGTTRRHADLARLDLRGGDGDPVIGIYVASARRFPLPLRVFEQHAQASQVFLPLGSHRFVVAVAPGSGSPDWAGITAFISAPGQGISLHRGCWHHGLIALGEGDRFAVIEGGGYRKDTMEVCTPEGLEISLAEPARG